MWKKLFKKAVRLLDASGIPRSEWSFGGGTALALHLHHRESRDVDIFFTDAQLLTFLTPRLNRAAAEIVRDYVEGSSFLKLKLAEGEIDFIVAPNLTRRPRRESEVEGESVYIETPEEIVVKKLFYRAETLKTRDVLDVAAAYKRRREDLLREAFPLTARAEALERRWEKLKKVYPTEAAGLLLLEPELLSEAPELLESFLKELKVLALKEKDRQTRGRFSCLRKQE
ncbi:MAG: nucleotidyl transferase AbiEii/AbiGii toxin family protein [Firmicutes bacterium]|nr:nucleotidyl transferase AbiEii/AbiGii toxin family protein [Bacillota bacterium]